MLRRRPYTVLLIVALAGLAVPFVTRGVSEWDTVFIPTARHLLHGDDFYHEKHGYVYPPFQAIFAMPVLPLTATVQRLAWYLVNALSLIYVLRRGWRLAGGPDLETIRSPWFEHAALGLGLLVGATYLFNSLSHHQTDIVLTALMFAGCEAILSQRFWRAATFIGIAAAMKCTPLLFVPYFIIRGRLFAAGWLLAVALGCSLLPDLIARCPTHATWLQQWIDEYILPMGQPEHRPGVWASDILFNQSLVGAVNRWTSTTWHATEKDAVTQAMEPLATPGQIRRVILLLAMLCGGISFVLMWKRPPNAWDFSILFAGMLLFSPMSSPAHFGVLLLPACAAARRALKGQRIAILLTIIMIGSAMLTNKDLWGAKIYTIALWYGAAMITALTALLAGWWGLWTSTPQDIA